MSEVQPPGSGPQEPSTIKLAKNTTPATLELRAAKLSDVGQARPHNEDYVDFSIPSDSRQLAQQGSIFLVADGMGGHQAGEVASRGAVEAVIANYQADTNNDVGTSLVRAFRAANQQIFSQAEADPAKGGMGTTLVVAVVLGRKVYVANVGDSRAYLIGSKGISQITEDHSWVEEQVRAGLLSEEQARRHPQRNLVTRALGSKPAVEVDLFEGEIAAGESLLLCSDGLTGRVTDPEIAAIVRENPPQEAARRLIALANERGGNDNITALVIHAEEGVPTTQSPVAAVAPPAPPRRSRAGLVLAGVAGVVLLLAIGAGALLLSDWEPLAALLGRAETPTATVTVSASPVVVTATLTLALTVTSTPTITPTATLSPTATTAAATSTATPTGPRPGAITLLSPDDEAMVTNTRQQFEWDYSAELPEDQAFEIRMGQGDPADTEPERVGLRTRFRLQTINLERELSGPGDYFWTVVVVETATDQVVASTTTSRTFSYASAAASPTP